MKIHAIFDWLNFSSWALLPTIMAGDRWVYLYWLRGRVGLRWETPRRP